jgi:lycopene beta-cyclase
VTDTDALVADMRVADVLVAGAGPAGRALAAELAVRGLSILLVDPHPDRPWQATHTGWLDELVTAPGFDPVRSGPGAVRSPRSAGPTSCSIRREHRRCCARAPTPGPAA